MEALRLFVRLLRNLRQIAGEHAASFRSEGFTALFETLASELGDDYFAAVDDHLSQLRFRGGVLLSAELGKGAKGVGYVLRRTGLRRQSWLSRISGNDRSGYTMRIADRDESGHRTLAELRGRGINLAANALAQSTDHILSFFTMLRCELGFYVGCLNARDQLAQKQEPISFPVPQLPGDPVRLSFQGLYDVCLSLRLAGRAVGNDVAADGKALVIITGANQGGKSTFLRSVGLAQLMMQCGMFVPAESFSGTVCAGLFTHYRREEDSGLESGKLDEELARMSEIAGRITPGSIVLFNESFAATNEREGSEIARQIVRALVQSGVRVFFVTHFFDLAHSLYERGSDGMLFLRAERQADGQRTFRLSEGEPEPTSYGQDLYEHIFGAVPDPAGSAGDQSAATA
jgi:DNA mismatch repair ATPase MutS